VRDGGAWAWCLYAPDSKRRLKRKLGLTLAKCQSPENSLAQMGGGVDDANDFPLIDSPRTLSPRRTYV
jgi:hypothetical protein